MATAHATLDDVVREGRKVFRQGQHAAEDAAASAVIRVRRRPLAAIAAAAGTGAALGALTGFAIGWFTQAGEPRKRCC